MMDIAESIKATYEQVGIAVLDVRQIENTPVFEMEFINADGHFIKPVVVFFMVAHNPGNGGVANAAGNN